MLVLVMRNAPPSLPERGRWETLEEHCNPSEKKRLGLLWRWRRRLARTLGP